MNSTMLLNNTAFGDMPAHTVINRPLLHAPINLYKFIVSKTKCTKAINVALNELASPDNLELKHLIVDYMKFALSSDDKFFYAEINMPAEIREQTTDSRQLLAFAEDFNMEAFNKFKQEDDYQESFVLSEMFMTATWSKSNNVPMLVLEPEHLAEYLAQLINLKSTIIGTVLYAAVFLTFSILITYLIKSIF